jgi:hypothetical protein
VAAPREFMRGPGGPGQQPQQPQTPPDDAQVRQNNARTLLFSLQGMLPQIDQYNPDRAAAVRQKLTDLGVNNNNAMNFGNQMRTAMQQGTSDSLLTAASTAPPQAQSFFYQQAAQKAIDEGNTDRAMQIANDHLNEAGKSTIMQAIDFKRLTTTCFARKTERDQAETGGATVRFRSREIFDRSRRCDRRKTIPNSRSDFLTMPTPW